jgi:hypothetical protein
MRRREFIALLGGRGGGVALAARAEQRTMPIVGVLGGHTSSEWMPFIAALNLGLKEVGFVEGQNVHIEYRWAQGHYDELPALAADLVRSRVAVIVAVGGPSLRGACGNPGTPSLCSGWPTIIHGAAQHEHIHGAAQHEHRDKMPGICARMCAPRQAGHRPRTARAALQFFPPLDRARYPGTLQQRRKPAEQSRTFT